MKAIDHLRFLVARLTNDDSTLAKWSIPHPDLMARLAGRSVALVGNARALAEGADGAAIDAADLVIRINRAPIPDPRSHGARTDWIALATRIPAETLAARDPDVVIWMSHKRKRLTARIAARPGFHLFPLSDWSALRDRLGAPPTTGLMMIDLLARSPAAAIALHGFDFFASLSLTGSRDAARVPHDFAAEKAFVDDLLARDTRFRLHRPGTSDLA